MMLLGFWQLKRGEEKKSLYAIRAELIESGLKKPLSLTMLNEKLKLTEHSGQGNALMFTDTPMMLEGMFTSQTELILHDNRIINGQVGFNILAPFEAQAQIILVNLGWVPLSSFDRREIPHYTMDHLIINKKIRLQGRVWIPKKNIFQLKKQNFSANLPKLIQVIELEKIQPFFIKPLAPFVLKLEQAYAIDEEILKPTTQLITEPITFLQNNKKIVPELKWMPDKEIGITPEKHFGYAIQWFTMSAFLIMISIYSRRSKE